MAQKRIKMVRTDIMNSKVRLLYDDGSQGELDMTNAKAPVSQATEINKFLNLYFGKEVQLTAVLQGCNIGNGFPYWIFAYKDMDIK